MADYCHEKDTWGKKCSLEQGRMWTPYSTCNTTYESYCQTCGQNSENHRVLDQTWSMGNKVVVEKYDGSFQTYAKLDQTWSDQKRYTLN